MILDSEITVDHADPEAEARREYTAEFDARKEAGVITPLDVANAAYKRAEQAVGVLTGDPESVPADKRAAIYRAANRVRECAAWCGKATRSGHEDLAASFASEAKRAALDVDDFDSARLDGLIREEPHADGRGRSARRYKR